MNSRLKWLAICGLVGVIAIGLSQAGDNLSSQAAKQQGSAGKAEQDRQADRDAIRATVKSFGAAFMAGDGAKAAAFLTEGAEMIPNDAPPIHGRKAIEEAITKFFAKNAKESVTLEVESLRFISRDTAIEEGYIKTAVHNQAPTSQRYSLLHVREDGKWLIGGIREWPSEKAEIQDLEWLIGTWSAKRNDVEIQATYEWIGNKAFIRGNISMRQKDRSVSGMQVIGIDPQSGELHIWVFESDGGLAEGTCTRDEDTWIFQTKGVLANGSEISAKNILLRVNKDTITWQPVNLLVEGEKITDLPPVKVTRKK